MIKKFSGAVAAATLGLTLFTGGVASAIEKPVVGTKDCTALVESNSAVTGAVATLDAARDDLANAQNSGIATTAQLNALSADVDQAVRLLAIARVNTTGLLCRTGPVVTTTTPAPAPSTTVVVPPRTIVQRPTTIVENPPVMIRPERRVEVTSVVPTRDDNSVAVTSGSQVTSVPEGSASTGQA